MTAPMIEVLTGDLQGRSYLVEEDEFLIGRAPSCDLVIPKRYISREHARIVRQGGAYVVDGLSETNPVLVDDRPARGLRLADGQVFEVCGIRFRFRAEGKGVPSRHQGIALGDGGGSESGRRPAQGGRATTSAAGHRWDDDDSGDHATAGDTRGGGAGARAGGRDDGRRSGAGGFVFGADDADPVDDDDRTGELPAVTASTKGVPAGGAKGAGKAGARGSTVGAGGSRASAADAGLAQRSSSDQTAELGRVQDPDDPDYDPFAEADRRQKKVATVDPAREKMMRVLMLVGLVGIAVAGGTLWKISQKDPWKTIDHPTPIRVAVDQTVLFEEPFAEIDPPRRARTTTPPEGEPAYIYHQDAVAEVEWAVPHQRTRAILLVRGKEAGETVVQLEYEESRRIKRFTVIVEGEEPHEAARRRRREELVLRPERELRYLADTHLASGETFLREKDVVSKEGNRQRAVRELVLAVDAAVALREQLARTGVAPPDVSDLVRRCEEAEQRAREEWDSFVVLTYANYKNMVRKGDTKVDLVIQLKSVLRAIGHACDPRFMRLKLLLEDGWSVPWDGDGSEACDVR